MKDDLTWSPVWDGMAAVPYERKLDFGGATDNTT